MALLFWDGFDHYGSVNDMLTRSGMVQYQAVSGSIVSPGRNGNGKELSGSFSATIAQRVAEGGIGGSWFLGSGDLVINFNDTVANAVQVQVVFRQRNFSIEVYRGNGSTLLYRSANNVFAEAQHYIEIWVKVDPTAGTVGIHMDQQSVVSLTGQNTQATANTWWDGFSDSSSGLDDLYYADTTVGPGSNPCNTFIGDPRVYTQFPTANAAVAFTPLANTNWQEVSETAFDGDISYNHSHNPGDEDLFNIGPVPTTITGILGLQIVGAYRKDDAGLRKIKQALKSSTTEVYGATHALPDSTYVFFDDIFPQDPATVADWTRAGVNAALIGYNLAA